MAVQYLKNQLSVTGAYALDAKLQPVDTLEDLSKIDQTRCYPGMTVVVMNNVYQYDEEEEANILISSNPQDYWFIGGKWQLKSVGGSGSDIYITGDDVNVSSTE